jgi:hypothetical protein
MLNHYEKYGFSNRYTKTKEEYGVRSASVKLAGNFMSYISDTLEFTEKSYASVF